MSNVKKIEIIHKHGKVIQKTTDHAFANMMGKEDWELITSVKDTDGDGKPDMNWTKSDIKKYLDAKGIEYAKSNNVTKADLIALV